MDLPLAEQGEMRDMPQLVKIVNQGIAKLFPLLQLLKNKKNTAYVYV